ncbi:MAG: ABC-2 family transporter protein, partial [Anaerolineae bacterium]|nr:ABC-2 family transporter protein [Anaerolineae bacterium]
MRGFLDIYRALFRTQLAVEMQYRASLVIWLIGAFLEPVIYLTVWGVVAQSSGGEVDGFTRADFAAYFIVVMLVNHFTFSWIMWEYEYYIRQGLLSPLLLRPLHPIHRDLADNLAYKLLTMVIVTPVTVIL